MVSPVNGKDRGIILEKKEKIREGGGRGKVKTSRRKPKKKEYYKKSCSFDGMNGIPLLPTNKNT
jgi:hypothetical protein